MKYFRTAKVWLFLALLAGIAAADSLDSGQTTVTTTDGIEVGTSSSRRQVLRLVNHDGTNPVYCGATSGVTSTTGFRVAAGGTLVIEHVAGPPLFCRATGGSVTVSWLEENG